MKKTICILLVTLFFGSGLFSCDKQSPPPIAETAASEPSDAVTETAVNESSHTEEAVSSEGFSFETSFAADIYKSRNSIKLRYRLYLPEGYNENEKYPLLVYLHSDGLQGSDNEKPLAEAAMLFENPSSPAFGSIVLVPQCPSDKIWADRPLDALMALTAEINKKYSTDPERQYYIGAAMGADAVWQLMEFYPDSVSAVVAAAGRRVHFIRYPDGSLAPVGLSVEMTEIPLCIAYNRDGAYGIGEEYNTALYDLLLAEGAENVFLKEAAEQSDTGCPIIADGEDSSVLEWLFAQTRPTGETAITPSMGVPADPNAERVDFDAAEAFQFGSFEASNGMRLTYRYYLPENYDASGEYPLLLILHTNGPQGSDGMAHISQTEPFFAHPESPVYGSIVLAPQCPENEWWGGASMDAVAELLAAFNEEFSTDRCRQYVTGMSMGAGGTWDLVMRYPELISAAVPVAGGGLSFADTGETNTITPVDFNWKLLKVPMYYVYDTMDEFSTELYQRSIVRTMLDYGAEQFNYRETTGLGHNICATFVSAEDISILEWLFSVERDTAVPIEADPPARALSRE